MSDGGPGRRRGGGALLVPVLAALLVAGPALAAPSPAPAQSPHPHRSWGLLAYDPGTGQLGLIAASTGFSVASGGAVLEAEVGAVLVHPRFHPGAGRRALSALREGRAPPAAARAAAARVDRRPHLVALLAPTCESAAEAADTLGAAPTTRGGRAGELCYLAAGVRTPEGAGVSTLIRGFRDAGGGLAERLVAALSAADRAAPRPSGPRSAVLWVAGSGQEDLPLGRAQLRLQVDDSGRPAEALAHRLRLGRADWLARRAGAAVDRGDFERAVALADSALSLDLSSAEAWLQRGRAQLHREKEREAERSFQRMLEIDPYLLPLLGDPAEESVRRGVIPYVPRLILRLDVYRRSFYGDLDFGPRPESLEDPSPPADSLREPASPADSLGGAGSAADALEGPGSPAEILSARSPSGPGGS